MSTIIVPGAKSSQATIRWTHTRLRRRILYENHHEDVRSRIRSKVGTERATAWGDPDLTCNVLQASSTALSALYHRPGAVSHKSAEDGLALEAALQQAGYWSRMPRVQRDTLGMREVLLRPHQTPSGELRLRTIWADMVECEATADDPEQPVYVSELRKRTLNGKELWTREIIDLRGKPVWRVEDEDGKDLSPSFLEDADGQPAPAGGLVGDAYFIRDDKGDPMMPYVIYHAELTGQLWDPWCWRSLVEGTLECCVHWTFFSHGVKNAAWPQRWVAAEVLGQNDQGKVVVDPAVLLKLKPYDGNTAIQVGQWAPGVDPSALFTALSSYERRVIAFAGLNPADVSRVSGDPRSGYALAVTRSGQRDAQRRFEPAFRASDERLMCVIGALLGAATSGYRIDYAPIPQSREEMQTDLEYIERRRDLGLMTDLQALRHLHPTYTEDQLKEALAELEKQRADPAAA